MIQRVQTVYLLFSAILLLLFLSFAGSNLGAFLAGLTWAMPVAYALAGLTAAVAFVAVFLYKQRATQAKVVMAAMWLDLLLVLVLAGAMGYLSFAAEGAVTPIGMAGYGALLLPVVAYVGLRMAHRGVKQDIELVRSMDRLR